MNGIELFVKSMDGAETFKGSGVFYCSRCRVVHREKVAADVCCEPLVCGCGAFRDRYRTLCEVCAAEASAKRTAEVMAKAEKLEEWTGPVFWEGYPHNEGYAASVDEFVEMFFEDEDEDESVRKMPEFVFVCHEWPLKFGAGDVIERETEDWPEGLADGLQGMEELEASCQAFCERNKRVCSWEVDYRRMVRVKEVQS